MYMFALLGLHRVNQCVCDCIWRMWCFLPGEANEMQTTQAESSGDVIYALPQIREEEEEEGRVVARCLSICVCVRAGPWGQCALLSVCV